MREMKLITSHEDENNFIGWYNEVKWGVRMEGSKVTYEEYKRAFREREDCYNIVVCRQLNEF